MSDIEQLSSKIIELAGCAVELKIRAELAECKLQGAEDRCLLILEAKNMWMDRAIKAESLVQCKSNV